MMLRIPRTSLIVLCGVAGCGKSTFAENNFKSMEIVSSDRCRAMVSDFENNMAVSKEAFELFHFIIQKRMEAGRLVVADSTALSHDARKKLLQLAKRYDYHTSILCFDVPIEMAQKRNSQRERRVSEKVIEKQYTAFKKALESIGREGFDDILVFDDTKIFEFSYEISEIGAVKKGSGITDIISDAHRFQGPLSLKTKSGIKVRIEAEEAENAVKTLYSSHVSPSWMVYIPPLIPSITNQSIEEQVYGILKYYRSRSVHRMVFDERRTKDSFVIIICKDIACSKKYFGSEKVGEIYSALNNLPIDSKQRAHLVEELHQDLVNYGYFIENDTDFLVFEGAVSFGAEPMIIPYRLLSFSSVLLYKQDSIWQMENIQKLCSCSKFFKLNRNIIIEDKTDTKALLERLKVEGFSEFSVRPVRAFPYYKGEMIQPEILCVDEPKLYGEVFLSLSTYVWDLSLTGLDRFIKNPSAGEHLPYLLGSLSLNSRMINFIATS